MPTSEEPTILLQQECQDQNTTGRRQPHNFSIDSILSSASSALEPGTEPKSGGLASFENGFDMRNLVQNKNDFSKTELFCKDFAPSSTGRNSMFRTSTLNNELLEEETDDHIEVEGDEHIELDAESRSSTPTNQANLNPLLDVPLAAAVPFHMFGISKGIMMA